MYQLIEASFGLFSASANGGGVAFFAHVGEFVFGLVVTWLLARRETWLLARRETWLLARRETWLLARRDKSHPRS